MGGCEVPTTAWGGYTVRQVEQDARGHMHSLSTHTRTLTEHTQNGAPRPAPRAPLAQLWIQQQGEQVSERTSTGMRNKIELFADRIRTYTRQKIGCGGGRGGRRERKGGKEERNN